MSDSKDLPNIINNNRSATGTKEREIVMNIYSDSVMWVFPLILVCHCIYSLMGHLVETSEACLADTSRPLNVLGGLLWAASLLLIPVTIIYGLAFLSKIIEMCSIVFGGR